MDLRTRTWTPGNMDDAADVAAGLAFVPPLQTPTVVKDDYRTCCATHAFP